MSKRMNYDLPIEFKSIVPALLEKMNCISNANMELVSRSLIG